MVRTMRERQREVQLYRGQVPSPGRPTVAWRQDRVVFWAAIARGDKTDVASAAAGVSSPVGYRWFRHAGGVNPFLSSTVSGRYLSFSEREDIALFRAQGAGVREIARWLGRSPSTISRELRRNASTRTWRLEYKATTAQWHAEGRARRPSPPSWLPTASSTAMPRTAWRGGCGRPMGGYWAPRVRNGTARTSPIAANAAGCRPGAPSRSLTA